MSAWPRSLDRIDCPAVSSTVNYLGPMDEFPVFYAENYQNNNLNLEEHRITIYDARPAAAQLALEEGGFVIVKHPTAVKDFRDEAQVERHYVGEVTELVRGLTGAPKVVVTRTVLRWSERAGDTTAFVNSRPARFVHVDYSRQSFDDFARMHLGTAGEPDPDRWLAGRYVAYNIWRVTTPPPQDVPLALCDARTTQPEDVVTGEAVIDRPGVLEMRFGSSLYRYNPGHRWFYFRNMQPDEALVFKAFDSDTSRVQGCPHSAFNHPDCPHDVPPRGSVEIRAYAYFG
jgi:hypothetical protein